MSEKLTVAELLARNAKEGGRASSERPRRRRSIDVGGVAVSDLTGSFPAVRIDDDTASAPSDPAEDAASAAQIHHTHEAEPVVESTQPAEPVQSVEVVEPVRAAEVVEPVEPAEPVRVAEGVEPAEPVRATEVVEPVRAAEVVEPVEPAEPVRAAEVVEPTEPAQPAEVVEPAEPVAPIEPGNTASQSGSTPPVVRAIIVPDSLLEPVSAAETPRSEVSEKEIAGDRKGAQEARVPEASPVTDTAELAEHTEVAEPVQDDLAAEMTEPSERSDDPETTGTAEDLLEVSDAGPTDVLEAADVSEAADTVDVGELASGPGLSDEAPNEPVAATNASSKVLEYEDDTISWPALVFQSALAIVVGVLIFFGFTLVWDNLSSFLALALALVVTFVCVGVVHALLRHRDTLLLVLTFIVGIALTVGPRLIMSI